MEMRMKRLMKAIAGSADAALIQSDVNRRYLTGMHSSAGTVLCFADCAYLVIDFRYIEKARATVKNCQVVEQRDLMEQIRELLKKHGAKRLAVESMEMCLSEYARLKKNVSDLVELDQTDMLSRSIYALRSVKTAEEIEKIRAAQQIAEIAYQDILGYLEPGRSERDIMMRLNQTMLEHGSEGESFPTIALTGTATSIPHGVPSSQRYVQSGDFVLMDYGATVDGYHSDMTRTVCVGQPTKKMQEVYDIVLEAQKAALSVARAGITGKELDKAARQVIESAGYGENFGHSLGHGVGLEIHEFPNASVGTQTVLQEGNVITVEPGIYLPGEFGVRIEDFVVIRENSCENLTKSDKHICAY